MSKINICIVGGLGYLGSELTKYFENNNNYKVTIVDINVFERQFYPINSILESSNFINLKSVFFDRFDKIVICSDIDINEFYCSEYIHRNYIEKYQEQIVELVKSNKSVFWVIPTDTGDEITEYVNSTKNIILDIHKNSEVVLIECPHLYGPSDSMRSDTFINKVVRDFIMNEAFYLDEGVFDIIDFIDIDTYAKNVINAIEMDNDGFVVKHFDCDRMSKVMICHFINSIFGSKHQLSVVNDDFTNINECKIKFTGRNKLESFIKSITTMLSNGQHKDFVDYVSDNNIIISNLVLSCKVKEKLF